MLNVGNIITLKNDTKYGILIDSILNNETYYLAVKLDQEEQPTTEYKVLKGLKKDGKEFVVEEKDPLILNDLLKDFNDTLEYIDDEDE